MKYLLLMLMSLATASAQSNAGKLLEQGMLQAIAGLEPVSDQDKSAILTATAGLLMKHVTIRPDDTASSICTASARQHVEWKHFVVRNIAKQAVTDADRLNGISRRFLVCFGCDAHRTWDSKKNAWGEWQPIGHVLFPAGVTLEWKGGKWAAVETDQIKHFTPGPGPSIAEPKTTGKDAGLPRGMTRGMTRGM